MPESRPIQGLSIRRLAEWRIEAVRRHAQTAASLPTFLASSKGTEMETLSQLQFLAALGCAGAVGIAMLLTMTRSQIELTQAMAARVAASIATLDDPAH